MVLWLTALLGGMAAVMMATSRTDSQVVRNVKDAARTRALADGGIWLAVHHLATRSQAPGPASHGTAFAYHIDEATVWVSVEDEAGKIDLNTGPPELFHGLFRSIGLDEARAAAIADAILDWRDADSDRRPAGAENEEYRRADLPYGPRNGPFEQIDELRLVLGMDEAVYALASPALTIHSGRNRIDPWAASREALVAVPGIQRAEVEAFLSARARVQQRGGARLPAFSVGRGYIERTPGPETFLIRTQAQLPGGARTICEAVIRLMRGSDPPYQVLLWRQGERPVAH